MLITILGGLFIKRMGLDGHQQVVAYRWTVVASVTFLLAGALSLVVQHQAIQDLRSSLRALTAGLGQDSVQEPTSGSATPSQLQGPLDVEALHDQSEIQRLTRLTVQLASEVAELEQMRDENDKLRGELARPKIAGLTAVETEALPKARDRALSIACVNNLKQVGLAVRTWALDNDLRLSPDFLSMSNELSTPKILLCPADTYHQSATDWSSFSLANCSYELLANFGLVDEPSRVLSRCPIHGHVGLVDGSVQMEVAKNHPEYFVSRDGKLYMEPSPVPPPAQSAESAPDNTNP